MTGDIAYGVWLVCSDHDGLAGIGLGRQSRKRHGIEDAMCFVRLFPLRSQAYTPASCISPRVVRPRSFLIYCHRIMAYRRESRGHVVNKLLLQGQSL